MKKKKGESLKIIIDSDARKAISDLTKIDSLLAKIEAKMKRITSIQINVTGKISGKDLLLASNRASGSERVS